MEQEPQIEKVKKVQTGAIQEKVARIFVANIDNGSKMSKAEMIKRAGGGLCYQRHPNMIFNRPGTQIAIQELLKEINFDKESKLNILAEIANKRTASGEIKNAKESISAIAEANKMVGDLAPSKTQNEDIVVQRNFLIKPE
jgi:hypothetical protein